MTPIADGMKTALGIQNGRTPLGAIIRQTKPGRPFRHTKRTYVINNNDLSRAVTLLATLTLWKFVFILWFQVFVIDEHKCELSHYMAVADGISVKVKKMGWWKRHKNELPTWSRAWHCSCNPHRAAERVLLILSNCFNDQQMHSLEVYIEYFR